MPSQRAASCPEEYERSSTSMLWLRTHVEAQHDDLMQGKFIVQFNEPPSRVSQSLATAIKDRELVEWTSRRFMELVGLREDIGLIFRSCSMPEAAWIPESRELVICYELLDYYYVLSAADR